MNHDLVKFQRSHFFLLNIFQYCTKQILGLESLDSDSSSDLVGIELESHTFGL